MKTIQYYPIPEMIEDAVIIVAAAIVLWLACKWVKKVKGE